MGLNEAIIRAETKLRSGKFVTETNLVCDVYQLPVIKLVHTFLVKIKGRNRLGVALAPLAELDLLTYS